MARCQLVRVGALGHVGRFASVDSILYPRGARVVARTDRGLESGEVLAPGEELHRSRTDGLILRAFTIEDELLEARLARHKQQAFIACAEQVKALGLPVSLMEVEHLFDGRSVFFYFLGEQLPELDSLVAELGEMYAAKVHFRRFAETLTQGCGPGCGTDAAAGGSCGGCGVGCAVAGACATRGTA